MDVQPQESAVSVLQVVENTLYQGIAKLSAMRGEPYTIALLARLTDDVRNERYRLIEPPVDQG